MMKKYSKKKKILALALAIVFIGLFFAARNWISNTEISSVQETEKPAVSDPGGKKIEFAYTDDNSGENLIIKTDKKTYVGISATKVYFSVTNIGKNEEQMGLQTYFPEKNGEVKSLKIKNEKGWEEIVLSDKSLSGGKSIIDQLLYKNPQRKPVPDDLQLEKSTGGEKIKIASGETQYFEMEIKFLPHSEGEFYLEAIGDKGGYGLLDPWFSSSWLYRIKLTAQNGKVDGDLSGFPVYVNLDDLPDATFWAHVKTACADVRVTKSDGTTELPREIVICDTGTKTGEMHFKADALANSSDTDFYIYYGNPSATEPAASDSNGSQNVWDTYYKGVWHFPNGSTLTALDSTSNGKNGTITGSAAAAGQIDGCANIANSSDKITVSSISLASGVYTISTWFKTPFPTTGYTTLTRGTNDHQVLTEATTRLLGVYDNAGGTQFHSSGFNVTSLSNGWHYLSAITSSTNTVFYIDGSSVGTSNWRSTDDAITLGNYGGGGQPWGYTDELRISTGMSRSVPWITTEYNNQNSTSTFYNLTAEEVVSDTIVSANGTQTANLAIPSTNQYVGGSFVITSSTGSRNVTGITITENGTVNAQTNLANAKLYYENDTSAPYDCAGESYGGGENQFGSTGSFNGADGTASFSGTTVGISTTSTMCVYTVIDVGAGAGSNDTLEIKINEASTDVTVSSGTVIDGAILIPGTTTLLPPANPQQIHYRWRNDDNGEMGNSPVWGDSNYAYRKKITITGQSGAGTDFQVKLKVGESSGSSGADFNLGGHVLSSFNDLRFTDNDGSTLLDYWIESISGTTPNQTAIVWVEVRDDLGSNTDIFAYYGYGSAAAYSNGDNTFIFFDDFSSADTSKFSYGEAYTYPAMLYDVSGGLLREYSDATWRILRMKKDFAPADNVIVRSRFKFSASSSWHQNFLVQSGGPDTARFGLLDASGTNWALQYKTPSSGYTTSGTLATLSADTWYMDEIQKKSSTSLEAKLYNDDGTTLGSSYGQDLADWSGVTWTWVNWQNQNTNIYMDWIYVRKYNATEPAYSSATSEEIPTAGATFADDEDATLVGLAKESAKRLRLEISNEGGMTFSSAQYRLEVSQANPVSCGGGTYTRISTSSDWALVDSSYIADGAATSNISPGLTDENSTFIPGQLKDTGDQTGAISLTGTQFTELEYSIEATSSATVGATYCFRLTNAGSTSGFSYPAYAQTSLEGGAPSAGGVDIQGTSNFEGSVEIK